MTCFTCDRELTPVWPSSEGQFEDAVMFETHGNYGSTVFDPQDTRYSLLIQICDLCLVERKDRVKMILTERPFPKITYSGWEPEQAV